MNLSFMDLEEFQLTLAPSQQQAYHYMMHLFSTGKQGLTGMIYETGTGINLLLKGVVEYAMNVLL